VYFVPAFVGLGAPFWDAQARGMITGLTRGSNVKHIIRAARESMAYQTKDVFDLMQQESELRIKTLAVDGGGCQSNFLMQFQADLLGTQIIRPKMIDSTIAGVAHLAGLKAGLWKIQDLNTMHAIDQNFQPRMNKKEAQSLYAGWQNAVRQVKVHP
jgi:glycerol kinase